MKSIDRTKVETTSLELSRKITEALEGISIEVRTYWAWQTLTDFSIKQGLTFESSLKISESFGCASASIWEKIPSYTTDDLMELLRLELNDAEIVRQVYDSFGYDEDILITPEALGKLLVYLIEEEIIKESYDN